MTESFKSAMFAMVHLAVDTAADDDEQENVSMKQYMPLIEALVDVFLATRSESHDKIAEDTCTAVAAVMLKYPQTKDHEFLFCWEMAHNIAKEIQEKRSAVDVLAALLRR